MAKLSLNFYDFASEIKEDPVSQIMKEGEGKTRTSTFSKASNREDVAKNDASLYDAFIKNPC